MVLEAAPNAAIEHLGYQRGVRVPIIEFISK